METRDHLFELIKSLSKSEKGYFKKVSSFHMKGRQNSYSLLFDAIDRMNEYDERMLKKKLPAKIAAQLSFLKHYLYHQLLEALDQYYQSSNVEINKMICKVEILHKKGLKEPGRKLLDKAMEFAAKKEKFSYLLHLTSLRYEFLADEENQERLVTERALLNSDLDQLRKKIDNLFAYHRLRIDVNLLRSETGYARSIEQVIKYEQFLKHPLLASQEAPLSGSAKFHYYTLHAIVQKYAHHYAAAYEALQHIDSLYTAYPVLFEESVSARIKTLQRKSVVACKLGRFDLSMSALEQMRNLKAVHEKYRALIFQFGYHQEFLIYLLTGQFTALLNRVPAFTEEYRQYGRNMLKTFEVQTLQRIAQGFFVEGRFEDAMLWINKAINTMPTAFHDDLMSGIKMDEVLIHFELGNHRVVLSKIAAAEKFLRSKKRPFVLEKFLLSLLKKMVKPSRREDQLEQWKKALAVMQTQFSAPLVSLPVKYFYIAGWMESKISGEPLSSLLKMQASQPTVLKKLRSKK